MIGQMAAATTTRCRRVTGFTKLGVTPGGGASAPTMGPSRASKAALDSGNNILEHSRPIQRCGRTAPRKTALWLRGRGGEGANQNEREPGDRVAAPSIYAELP